MTEANRILAWEEAPQPEYSDGPTTWQKWEPVVAELVGNPNREALIFVGTENQAASLSQRIRQRNRPFDVPDGTIHAKRRRIWLDHERRKAAYRVYVVYVPKPTDEPAEDAAA
jgi:hypothetical protein